MREPMECPWCKEISFEHIGTEIHSDQITLEFECPCGALGYFDEVNPDYDPTPDEQGEPPISAEERYKTL